MPRENVPDGYDQAESHRWEVHASERNIEREREAGDVPEFIRLVIGTDEHWGTLHLVIFAEDDPLGTPRQSIPLQPKQIADLSDDLSEALSEIYQRAVANGATSDMIREWFEGGDPHIVGQVEKGES